MALTWYGGDEIWRPYIIVQINDTTYVEVVKSDSHQVDIYVGNGPPQHLGMYRRYGVPRARFVRNVTVDDDDWEMIEQDPRAWVISRII
mgnify:CR=1 FL=1